MLNIRCCHGREQRKRSSHGWLIKDMEGEGGQLYAPELACGI